MFGSFVGHGMDRDFDLFHSRKHKSAMVEDAQDKEELDDDEYIWAVGPVDGKLIQVL